MLGEMCKGTYRHEARDFDSKAFHTLTTLRTIRVSGRLTIEKLLVIKLYPYRKSLNKHYRT